jgi:hypothetical protein
MTHGITQGTGVRYRSHDRDTADRRLRAHDRPGEHLWVMTAAWFVEDPERPEYVLDMENLFEVAGVGCFKCEGVYSRKLAKRRCRGSVNEVMP